MRTAPAHQSTYRNPSRSGTRVSFRLGAALGWFTLGCGFLAGPSWSQPLPVINSFTASPTVTNPGVVTKLSWSVANATSVSIDQGVGDVSGTNSIYVGPVLTTTYTLTAVSGVKPFRVPELDSTLYR